MRKRFPPQGLLSWLVPSLRRRRPPQGLAPAAGPAYDYLLDHADVPTATSAYSFRVLREAYTGPQVNLREDATDTNDDFTYDVASGQLLNGSSQTVAAWLAANSASNAYVETWYDQVGSNDLTNATHAQQPLLVASAMNGMPGADFDGTDDRLSVAFSDITNAPLSWAAAVACDLEGTSDCIGGIADASSFDRISLSLSPLGTFSILPVLRGGTTQTATTISAGAAASVIGIDAATNDRSAYLNNAGVGTNSSTSGVTGVDTLMVGALGTTGGPYGFYAGDISEFIIFASAIDSDARAAIDSSHSTVYGTGS